MDPINNNEEQDNVTHRPETLHRITIVQDMLLDGIPRYEVVREGMRLWNVQKSMMYVYISEALKEINERDNTKRLDERQFHIQMLMRLYSEVKKEKMPGYIYAATNILKDVAKLKGLYPSANEWTGDQDCHVTLKLK